MSGSAPPLLTLVTGPEEVLADRGVDSVVALARELEPDIEVVRLDASSYAPGDLGVHAGPSLFGGGSVTGEATPRR